MPKAKTKAQLDREIEALLNSRARYMLVNAETGKDMREALDFEIAEIQKHRSKRFPEGRGVLELGAAGPGASGRTKTYDVTLRLMNMHQPTRAERRNPTLPKGETFAARDRHGNVVATSQTIQGAMQHADRMLQSGSVSVRGEYTSNGTHWGLGKGREVARRENGRWLVG